MSHKRHAEHLVRVHQQPQHEEHDNLKEPRKPVHERGHFFAIRDAVVADDHPRQVDRQVAVAVQQPGGGEGEEGDREEEDGIKRCVVYVQSVQTPDGKVSDGESDGSAHSELYREEPCHVPQSAPPAPGSAVASWTRTSVSM